jgi:hypothetical protein
LALDEQLFKAGLRHGQVLLDQLEEGFDFSHQASQTNGEIRGSAEVLHRIETSSYLGDWRYIPIECKLASKPRTTFLVQASAYCEPLTTCWGRGRITLSCTWAVVASAPTTPIAAGLGTSSDRCRRSAFQAGGCSR